MLQMYQCFSVVIDCSFIIYSPPVHPRFTEALVELEQNLEYDLAPGDEETANAAMLRIATDPAFIDLVGEDVTENDNAEEDAEEAMESEDMATDMESSQVCFFACLFYFI